MRGGIGSWKRAGAVRVAFLMILALGGLHLHAGAAEFVVNSYGEESDANPGDGVAEIQAGTGITTFHAAIEEANAFPGPDTIRFDLEPNDSCQCTDPPICKVRLEYTRPLPPINDTTGGTTIDASPGEYLGGQLSGVSWMSGAHINPDLGDPDYNAALVILSANNVVKNLAIYKCPGDGIVVSGPNASSNMFEFNSIGAACPGVDGCGGDGIRIEGGASGNSVIDSRIVDSSKYGIKIVGDGSDGNLIVKNFIGQTEFHQLVVCGTDLEQITERTEIQGSPMCLAEKFQLFTSSTSKPNKMGQVFIGDGASENVVGGMGIENANFIGGSFWISEFTSPDVPECGYAGTPPASWSGTDSGVILDGVDTSGNVVQSNYIGYRDVAVILRIVTPSGPVYYMQPRRDMASFAYHSVHIRNGASDNLIGSDDDPALGNIIGHSFREGIMLDGSETVNNRIANNRIVSEADGVAFQNGANHNTLGAGGGNGNVIRAREYGVELNGASTTANQILGNTISRNGFSGVALRGGATGNTVGGVEADEANLLNYNCSDGVVIFDPGSDSNQILGNEIANNGEIGVFMVNGASDNIIGGTVSGAGNDIHDNAVTGVEIHNDGTTGNQILGNEIHANGTRGIFMVDGTSGNIVGGVDAPERNRVYNNGRAGIEINGANTEENQIRINAIYDNVEKGILLAFGANQGIEPPVIAKFIPFSGTAPPDSFVDIFSDEAEEGRNYIGSTMADTDGNYSVLLNLSAYRNTNLTTTATDAMGNTSEFSAPIAIIPPEFTEASADRVIVEGDNLSLSVSTSGSPEILYQWRFRPDGGVFADLADGGAFSGVTTPELALEDGQPAHEGFYQCVADNGLGAVNSRQIFVRVVAADLNELQVNSLADGSDGNTSSFARLLAAPGDDGVVTLREAIAAANTMTGENTIRFSVEGSIQIASALPAIADASGGLLLDGGEVLAIDGSLLEGTANGLSITSAGNHIKGLGVYNFPRHGIVLSGGPATGNAITGCTIGTDGTAIKANGGHGILLSGGATENLIGGSEAGERNVIAGNGSAGVALLGNGTASNRIQGNTIGKLSAEADGGGNVLAGVFISERAADNRIGGDLPEDGNRITGNIGIGVYVTGGGTVRNTIRNNTIFGNGDLGIRLFEGGNAGIARPAITSAAPLAGTAPPGSAVDCYADAGDEGETFLVSLVADGEGAFGAEFDLSAYDSLNLTAIATDSEGNTSAFSAPAPLDFTPPELALNGAASLTLECGAPFDDPGATATDNLDGDITSHIVVEILDGSNNPVSSLETAGSGVYTVRYTVSDNAGLAATPATRPVTVEDTAAPTLTLLGDATVDVNCGVPFEDPGATVEDGCAGDVPVEVAGTVDYQKPGSYTLTYTAEDAAGNAAIPVTRTVNVADGGKPAIILIGESMMQLECGAPYVEPGATVQDDCEADRAATVTGTVDTGRVGTNILTYNATDGAGNRADTVQRVVMVTDTTPPVLTLNGAAEVTLHCGDAYPEPGAALADACDPGTDVAISGDFNPNVAGVYTRQYDATDTSGNAAEPLFRTITVVGQNPPVIFLTGDASVTVACNTTYQDAGARAQDGCLADITADLVSDNPVDTSQPGTYTVTYNVTDGAGEAAAPVSRTVTVLPCVGPCDAQCSGDPDNAIDEDGDGLSKCKEACVGTSDQNVDSDGDGMPDGFEYQYRLNPKADDSAEDPDGDGSTNLEEYLEGGSPRSASTPVTSFFVNPSGTNAPAAGTQENPWQTIAYAMSRITPGAGNRIRVFLGAGLYAEDVTLKAYAELRAVAGADVEIMGSMTANTGSTLTGVTCTSDGAGTAVLFLAGGATVRDCAFNGEFGQNLTGIAVEEGSTSPSTIEDSEFMNLDVGVDVSGPLPSVRRCSFSNIAVAAILLRESATVSAGDSVLGHGLNGWNDFGQLGSGLAILNESAATVPAQWNDWGTDSSSEQAALVDGDVDQGNALTAGESGNSAALDVVVFNGASQARTSGASVTATGPAGTLSATTASDGRAAFPTLPAGSWQLAVTASGFPEVTRTVTLGAGTRRVVNFALLKEDSEPPPPAPSCPAPAKSGAPGDRKGDLLLFTLLLAGLVAGQRRRT